MYHCLDECLSHTDHSKSTFFTLDLFSIFGGFARYLYHCLVSLSAYPHWWPRINLLSHSTCSTLFFLFCKIFVPMSRWVPRPNGRPNFNTSSSKVTSEKFSHAWLIQGFARYMYHCLDECLIHTDRPKSTFFTFDLFSFFFLVKFARCLYRCLAECISTLMTPNQHFSHPTCCTFFFFFLPDICTIVSVSA